MNVKPVSAVNYTTMTVAFIPAAALGLAAGGLIKSYLFKPVPVALAFIVGGVIILLVDRGKRSARVESTQAMTALDALKDGPLTSAELGVRIHRDARSRICDYCRNGLDCFYAEADGAHVAASLRSHGLTKFSRKRGVWYLVELGLPPEAQSRADDQIPF